MSHRTIYCTRCGLPTDPMGHDCEQAKRKSQAEFLRPKELVPSEKPASPWHRSDEVPPPRDGSLIAAEWNCAIWIAEYSGDDSLWGAGCNNDGDYAYTFERDPKRWMAIPLLPKN